jgi:D-lyxose ketol-isomerase
MIMRKHVWSAQECAAQILQQAGIAITPEERQNIEVSDFGLGELEQTGLELVVYINTDRYCAKELILFSNQTCPEHCHPKVAGALGKVEPLRCRSGRVRLYVEGEPTPNLHGKPQVGNESHYTVFHEIALNPSEQYTFPPDNLHWFQEGDSGAIVSEFSNPSDDKSDMLSNPRIRRIPEIT